MAMALPAGGIRIPSYEGLRCAQAPHVMVEKNVGGGGAGVGRSFKVFAQRRVVKKRKILLKEDVEFLGKAGDLVQVRAGYFRNFLYPFGKAVMATPDYLMKLKYDQEQKEAEEKRVLDEAESLARELQAIGMIVIKRTQGSGKLIFGSVTNQDVADILEDKTNRKIDKRMVTVPEIRQVGQFIAEIKLHPQVITTCKINVIS